MPTLPFRVVDAAEASQFRAVTAGRDSQIDPRRVEAGPGMGQFAFPENVMFDPAFEDLHDLIRVSAPQVSFLDTEIAWPAPADLIA